LEQYSRSAILAPHKDALGKVAVDKAAEEANQLEARARAEAVIALRQASYSALGANMLTMITPKVKAAAMVAIENIGESVGSPFVIGGSYATLVIADAIRCVLAEEQYPVPTHAGMEIPLLSLENSVASYCTFRVLTLVCSKNSF
jgi:hypothetical protein